MSWWRRARHRLRRDESAAERIVRDQLVTAVTRQDIIRAGIVALHDTMRVLRGVGAGRVGAGSEADRGAMFDLSGLADRLVAYAEDQGEDDWDQFWVTGSDVATLRARTESLAMSLVSLSAASVAALRALADALEPLIETDE
jgi:hypothetical protein